MSRGNDQLSIRRERRPSHVSAANLVRAAKVPKSLAGQAVCSAQSWRRPSRPNLKRDLVGSTKTTGNFERVLRNTGKAGRTIATLGHTWTTGVVGLERDHAPRAPADCSQGRQLERRRQSRQRRKLVVHSLRHLARLSWSRWVLSSPPVGSAVECRSHSANHWRQVDVHHAP